MPKELPLPLTHAEAKELADDIEQAVARVRMDFIRRRRPDLDDPNGNNAHGTKVIYHELALALGRCCVRYGFDILPDAAASHIDRLEVALAEANATQERFRESHIVPPAKFPDGSHQGNGKAPGKFLGSDLAGKHHDGCTCELCRGH